MNTNIKCVLAFTVGAAVGSVVSWKFLRTTYERIAQEEIDSVKEAFARREECGSEPRRAAEVSDEPEQAENAQDEKPSIAEYAARLAAHGYTDYAAISSKETEGKKDVERPYVISPDEFGEFYDYEQITLTHYSDGVLADENDEIVDDVDDTVGSDYADHFGEHEEDSVHVRNDKRKCDYEILRDYRSYSDVVGTSPHQAEV